MARPDAAANRPNLLDAGLRFAGNYALAAPLGPLGIRGLDARRQRAESALATASPASEQSEDA